MKSVNFLSPFCELLQLRGQYSAIFSNVVMNRKYNAIYLRVNNVEYLMKTIDTRIGNAQNNDSIFSYKDDK